MDGASRVVESCRRSLLKISGTLDQRIARVLRPARTKSHKVVLLTMHGSKGLEFHTVWVYGCQSNTIPHPKCTDIEEERRLLYVAMTRAQRVLHLSFAHHQVCTRQTKDGGQETHLRQLAPSAFLVIDMGLAVSAPQLEALP